MNGMTIFSGPKTNSEIIWSIIMNIFLFPLNIILQNYSTENQWHQTIIIYLNSVICGGIFSILYYFIKKRLDKISRIEM